MATSCQTHISLTHRQTNETNTQNKQAKQIPQTNKLKHIFKELPNFLDNNYFKKIKRTTPINNEPGLSY